MKLRHNHGTSVIQHNIPRYIKLGMIVRQSDHIGHFRHKNPVKSVIQHNIPRYIKLGMIVRDLGKDEGRELMKSVEKRGVSCNLGME